jgi:anaerobic ribonucleoside-triphosphate reductase
MESYMMDELKQRWLGTYGINSTDDIADCNMQEQTVTYSDGTVRQLCEVYTRVMGYFSPKSRWNPGKQAEHQERAFFLEPA